MYFKKTVLFSNLVEFNLDLSQNVFRFLIFNKHEIDKFWKIYKQYLLIILNYNKEDVYNKNTFNLGKLKLMNRNNEHEI